MANQCAIQREAKRSATMRAMFINAAVVQKLGLDPSVLHYPSILNMAMDVASPAVHALGGAAAFAEQAATFQKGKGLGVGFWIGLGVVGFGAWKLWDMKKNGKK